MSSSVVSTVTVEAEGTVAPLLDGVVHKMLSYDPPLSVGEDYRSCWFCPVTQKPIYRRYGFPKLDKEGNLKGIRGAFSDNKSALAWASAMKDSGFLSVGEYTDLTQSLAKVLERDDQIWLPQSVEYYLDLKNMARTKAAASSDSKETVQGATSVPVFTTADGKDVKASTPNLFFDGFAPEEADMLHTYTIYSHPATRQLAVQPSKPPGAKLLKEIRAEMCLDPSVTTSEPTVYVPPTYCVNKAYQKKASRGLPKPAVAVAAKKKVKKIKDSNVVATKPKKAIKKEGAEKKQKKRKQAEIVAEGVTADGGATFVIARTSAPVATKVKKVKKASPPPAESVVQDMPAVAVY
jgi:hypothetical protein